MSETQNKIKEKINELRKLHSELDMEISKNMDSAQIMVIFSVTITEEDGGEDPMDTITMEFLKL